MKFKSSVHIEVCVLQSLDHPFTFRTAWMILFLNATGIQLKYRQIAKTTGGIITYGEVCINSRGCLL
jgi:hypothetical protein